MQFYKLTYTQLSQLDLLNENWVQLHRAGHPDDTVTERYCDIVEFLGEYYIIKDATTEQYITDYIDVVSGFPSVSPVFFARLDNELHGSDAVVMIVDGKVTGSIPVGEVQIVGGSQQQLLDYVFSEQFDLSQLPSWQSLVGRQVMKGQWCMHGNIPYICVSTHTVQQDWRPDIAFSLWAARWPDGVIGDWKQPAGAHDTYSKGMKVRHTGWIWVSNIKDNVWAPGVHGWERVSQIETPGEPPVQPPVQPPVTPPANPCEGIPVWSNTQHWSTYTIGDRRRDGGKAWECHNPAWAQSFAPSSPWGHMAWTFLFDCP